MPAHCIYEVRYEFQWHSSEPTHWEYETVRVLAAQDATAAIDKVRTAVSARKRLDENGREEHCTGFRLREVVLVAEAEL